MSVRIPERPQGFNRSIFGLLLVFPALVLGYLTFLYGVDTPWADQWDGTAQLFEEAQAGTLTFSDFYAFHNEHRMLFPRLLQYAIARLTHWNIRAEMFVIWLLLCACALSIWQLAKATGWGGNWSGRWLLLASNVLLFTPLQWENLLWGFQIGFLLPIAATTWALALAVTLRRPFDFASTMILCLVTTFSTASGFASWILVAPALFFGKERVPTRWNGAGWLLWMATACATTYAYFLGFVQPSAHPSELYGFSHPIDSVQFLLSCLGSPFAFGTAIDVTTVSQIVGAILLVNFALCIGYLWRSRRERSLLACAVPWVSLAGVALTNAILITIGRVGFGISVSLQSRYVTYTVTLPIALLFLSVLFLRHWRAGATAVESKVTSVQVGGIVYASALGTLLLLASAQSMEHWRRFHHVRLLGKATVTLSRVIEDSQSLQRYVHWAGVALLPRMIVLDRLGYLHPPLLRSRSMSAIAANPGGNSFGKLTSLSRNEDGSFAASGWAILPLHHRVADSVLMAYENEGGEWMLFARTDVGGSLPAAPHETADETYQYSAWHGSWKAGAVPPGTRRISAWSFDAEACHAYPIGVAAF